MSNVPNAPLFEVVEIDRRQFLRIAGGALISLSALSLVGCGGGGGGTSSGGTLTPLNGKVVLSSKAATAAGKLTASNVSGQQPVAATGGFSLPAPSDGASLVVVSNSTGVGLLMGFVDPSKQPATIDAKSTVAALMFFAFGCPKLPANAKGAVVDYLLAHAATATCAEAVSSRLDASITAISDGDSTIAAELKTAFQAIRGTSAPGSAPAPKNLKPADVSILLISPSNQQSGIEIDHGGKPETVIATNNFHVPARLYLYKVGTVDEGTPPVTTTFPKAQPIGQPIDIKGTAQLNSLSSALSLLQLLQGISVGVTPYAPIVSSPISVALDPGKSKTLYSLISVGASTASSVPSFFADPALQDELPGWEKEHDFLCVYVFLMDICLGIFFEMLGITKFVNDASAVSAALAALENIQDTAWKQILTSVKAGQFGPALKSALTAVGSNGYISQNVRAALAPLDALVSQRAALLAAGASKITLTAASRMLLAAPDLILGFGNLSATLLDLNDSHYADRWDITLSRPTIRLSPTTVSIVGGQLQSFVVTPPTGLAGKIVYDWKYSGPSDSYITDEDKGRGASFESAATTIFLISSQVDLGSASLNVEAFLIAADNSKTSIGIAQASITFTKKITTEPGTFDVVSFPEDTGRYGVIAIVRFAPVAGATSYSVHGTGGNDTAAYGTEINVGVAAGNWPNEYDGTLIPNCVALSGYNGGVGSNFEAAMHARFDGFTFVVTPSY